MEEGARGRRNIGRREGGGKVGRWERGWEGGKGEGKGGRKQEGGTVILEEEKKGGSVE